MSIRPIEGKEVRRTPSTRKHPIDKEYLEIRARLARADHKTEIRAYEYAAEPQGNRLCEEPCTTSAKVDAAHDLHSKNMNVKR